MSKTETKIIDRLTEAATTDEGIHLDPVRATKEELNKLLNHQPSLYDRNKAAIYYADLYRREIEAALLDAEQQRAAVVNKVFLSSVGSTAQLRRFITAGFILGDKDSYTAARKRIYLEARKQFQADVDGFFDYFSHEPAATRGESLREIVTMSRELVSGKRKDIASAMYVHHFLGSVLSERAVKVSLQKNVHEKTRYGTAEEDRRPYMADIVVPMPEGNMPLQVKMRTVEDARFVVRPLRKVPHVFMPMPMPELRAELTSEEHETLALSILEANEFGQWQPLQTEVNELELAA